MAHNENLANDNFANQNVQPCVDERREHLPVVTESQAFDEFDQWMDVALDRLVNVWIKSAAPRAAQQRFWGPRFKGK